MLRFHTILVPVDFSETSEDALIAALELARQRSASLHILHVVPDTFRTPYTIEPAGLDLEAVQREWVEGAQRQLRAFTANHNLPPTKVTTAVAVGSPASAIVQYARDHAIDMIVLGSHGHGLVRRFLLGNVAERVMRVAECPVMVVPHRTVRMTSYEVKAASGVED